MDNLDKTTTKASDSQFSLNENDFLALSNIVIYNALLLHQKELKSNHVPATFIQFYISELSDYDHMFDAKLRLFFEKLHSAKTRISVLMRSFQYSFPNFAVKVSSDKNIDYLDINNTTIPEGVIYYNQDKRYLGDSINTLKEIINHFNNNDELRSVEYIYKDYLYMASMQKSSANETDNNANKQQSNSSVQPISENLYDNLKEIESLKNNTTNNTTVTTHQPQQLNTNQNSFKPNAKAALLTGRMIELPVQKGKVVNIIFPELPLPCDYPTLIEKSRVNTEMKVKKFMTASDELNLVNNFRFAQIKYSLDFINKRKVIAYDLKRASRFDFKF